MAELKGDASAIVFLGDSIEWKNPPGDGTAVGLKFVDASVIKTDRMVDTVDPRDNGQSFPFAHTVYVHKMKTQAKIVFIGACVIGSQFKEWWDINDDSTDQAFVVPVLTAPTGLKASAFAWKRIQETLMAGKSLKEAVDAGNAISFAKFQIIGGKVVGGANGSKIFLR